MSNPSMPERGRSSGLATCTYEPSRRLSHGRGAERRHAFVGHPRKLCHAL